MLNKVCGLARAIGILLAIVAGFVALGGLNTALVLVVLGLIGGIAYGTDDLVRLGVLALALPAVGTALGNIPSVGGQLGAVCGNLAVLIASALASAFAIRLFNIVKGDVMGLAAK
jgi:hypothetical protein